MRQLSISVAVAAAIALVASIAKGGVDVLGLAVDPTLLSIGAVGLMLALTTFRSPLISRFLRVFSTIFAVEYVMTGLAHVGVEAGWWPLSLEEAAPPASLPTTVAIFGLLVYLISFIPVNRQITRLADPYFMTNDRGNLQIAGFGARHVTERRFVSSLIVALVVINQLQVAINVRLSFFNRDWFNAIQNKDSAAFWSLLIGVFCFWAAIAVVSNLVEYYTESVLKIRWRRWMTELSQLDLLLLDQPAVDSVDTRFFFDHPMDDPCRLHHSGNRHYRSRTAVLGCSAPLARWHLADPFDRQATRSA